MVTCERVENTGVTGDTLLDSPSGSIGTMLCLPKTVRRLLDFQGQQANLKTNPVQSDSARANYPGGGSNTDGPSKFIEP